MPSLALQIPPPSRPESPVDLSQPPLVSSTSPPCQIQLPPSPGSAPPPKQSILLNPLPLPSSASTSPTLSFGAALARRFSVPERSFPPPRSTNSTEANATPGPVPRSPPAISRRRPSIVVEIQQSAPPAHFFHDDDDAASYSSSPPRGDSHGVRSRSVSPAPSPLNRSPAPSPGLASGGGGSGSSVRSSSSSSGREAASGVKFAPLPAGRKTFRSNSLSIGVASRANLIQGSGGAPNLRGARHAGPLQWYEQGGETPDGVYDYKDAINGIKKLFSKGKSKVASSSTSPSTASAPSATSTSPPTTSTSPPSASNDPSFLTASIGRGRPRSASVVSISSNTSSTGASCVSNSELEARRMEQDGKTTKGSIEHIEEAIDEEEEEEEVVPATMDDMEGEEEVDGNEPQTPPTAGGVMEGDADLAAERRRARKGKAVVRTPREEDGPKSSILV